MTLMQVWGALLVFLLCPFLGGLPLIAWSTRLLTGQRLSQLGTGNVSVSAAFYHGGKGAGILAVLSEALKGVAAVLLARHFFPTDPVWEVFALIALVMGRYWFAKGAGTTNVVWGFLLHDPVTSLLIALIGGIGFTLLRERQLGKWGVLGLIPLLTALRHPHAPGQIGATLLLSLLIGWIYQKIPDDLNLPSETAQTSSRSMFRFFRGDRALLSLDQRLSPEKVGQKAATLSQLKAWGYPVPAGWVLPPGDDPAPLIESLRLASGQSSSKQPSPEQPSPEQPWVVRSSAIGEDSETASAAGQYESLLNITSLPALEQAILRCQASYTLPTASRYRQERGAVEGGMAVIVQQQIQGMFSGVAFSRDPITRQGDAVLVEALPGLATQVVSGQRTPEQYRVWIGESEVSAADWRLPEQVSLPVESSPVEPGLAESSGGTGDVPLELIQQVAYLARQLEGRYHGIPQDIEWSYDGELWLLQARPITTLLPIWTRKIAAEVIPGWIHPLTWSINRPLTCGVWGEIFTLVLGDRARGLDFAATATLHRSAAYFNASLLGDIFRRMGLPPESLEFLTRGAKFSKPPLGTTLRNLPGLVRLAQAEWRLPQDFDRDLRQVLAPGLAQLAAQPREQLTPTALLSRIQQILALLKCATYYSIMAPLSVALRQAILRVSPAQLDNSQMPEVAAIRAIQALAASARSAASEIPPTTTFADLMATPAGQALLPQFNQLLDQYGYLSEVGTDIAVPTWKEDPRSVQTLFMQFWLNPPGQTLSGQDLPKQNPSGQSSPRPTPAPTWKVRQAQQRLNLKGQVTAVYSKLLAELRWSFVALESLWLQTGRFDQAGDLFFLSFDEIQRLVTEGEAGVTSLSLSELSLSELAQRRQQLDLDCQQVPPLLVYGNTPPLGVASPTQSIAQLSGIAASPGQIQGRVRVLQNFQDLQDMPPLDRTVVLVVPYTDSGWAALLAQAGGLIAEVGGQLSHGAIVAREYGLPAVVNVPRATQILKDGQTVWLDGSSGRIELLD